MKTFLIQTAAILVFGILCEGNVSAQQSKNVTVNDTYFKNAVGLRFGTTTGITYKHRFTEENALELILGTHAHAVGITGLYERYVLTNVEGLNLYFGGGAHISRGYYSTWGYNYNPKYDQYYYYEKNYHYGPIVGLDAIGGIEYRLSKAPVAFNLDLKPFAEFYRGYKPNYRWDPGLGVKFTF